jgi:alpha-1,6-mannosyltransferase
VSRGRAFGLAASGALLLALTGLGLALQRHRNIDGFVAVALAQGVVYLVAVALVRQGGGSRRALAAILAAAAAMRLVALAAPPYLSTDIYRYVWDGRVQGAGINPFRYIPVDPHLAALRDTAIFPNVNRSTYAPTIYPPLAEGFFFLVTRFSESLTAMKAAMVGCEAAAIVLLLRLLAARGLPPERILVYAWHPLPLWEFAGSGHVDALVVLLVALALWGRRRLPQWLLGVVLAGLALVKFFPAVIAPALWRRRDWQLPAGFAAAVLLCYLPYRGAGWKVLGFLGGYAGEEGFDRGGAGFYLWDLAGAALPLAGIGAIFYIAGAAVLLLLLGAFVALAPPARDRAVAGAALLAAAFTLLLSPHYPWYFAWLVVFACLLPWISLLWLTGASFLLYLVPVGSHIVVDSLRLAVESVLYLPFAALALFDLSRARSRPPGAAER